MLRECRVHEELLAEYIATGNEVIERKKQLELRPRARRELRPEVDSLLRQRARVFRSLRKHREEHGC